MNRCIQLAKTAVGKTYPNPMVGCVIVYENQIIGEGFHLKSGNPHAEVMAINSVKNKELLSKSTLFVSLEPCSHFGKTPPCSDLILKYKIPKVVIGTKDLNSEVNGKGILKLRQNGVEVKVNILKKECTELNKRFFTFHREKRPFITLKWAESNDGFIDKKRELKNIKTAKSTPISNKYSRQISHRLRTTEQAILVGKNTVIMDNPKLNSRQYFGKNPIKITIDKNLELDENYNIFQKGKTIVFNSKKHEIISNIDFVKVNFKENLTYQILSILYEKNIQSIIVEGGSKTLNHFIKHSLWDEIIVFKSDKNIKENGVISPVIPQGKMINKTIVNDRMIVICKK